MTKNQKYIYDQVCLLNIPERDTHNLIYFYYLQINNKECLTVGYTTCDLFERLCKYILIENKKKKKKMDTFRLLAVYNYENLEFAKSIDILINSALQKYPLIKTQPSQTKQYMFVDSWKLIKNNVISGLMFSSEGWVHPDITEF